MGRHSFFKFLWLLVQIVDAESLRLRHVVLVVLHDGVFGKLDGVRGLVQKLLAMLIDLGHQSL